MKRTLLGLLALVTLAWSWTWFTSAPIPNASLAWTMRQQALNLSGLYAIALMSLCMVLAVRPAWLERPLGGLDRIYRLHKWSGIGAVVIGSLHWLIQLSGGMLKTLVGREGRPPKPLYDGFLEVLRKLSEDIGEWAIYLALAMLVLTLCKRLPYRPWRQLHRVMPVIYLMLAFHAALLAPPTYWQQPVGWLLGALLAAGAAAALWSLAGRIGRQRQVDGRIVCVQGRDSGITEVNCQLDARWSGHRAGQFAFISFDHTEGQHPFTIASADRGDRTLSFQIKGLGDYTHGLATRLQVGQPVRIEGPYGRFDLARRDAQARQIWVAGGIGVTPFLAWLESLQGQPQAAPEADLHYCTRDRSADPFVPRLQALCATLPGLSLQVHGALQGEVLSATTLSRVLPAGRRAEVWFCGPQGLAQSLRTGLQKSWPGPLRFHQEAFDLR